MVSTYLWTNCGGDGDTSHSRRAGYAIDVRDGSVDGNTGHYSPFFNSQIRYRDDNILKLRFPEISDACQIAVEAHKMAVEIYPWCPAIGWDCMIDEDGQMVFFEGNQASYRLPRRIFMCFDNLVDFLREFFWPFDDLYSVQPFENLVM